MPVQADLLDGQVIATSRGEVGIIDWDTLARGEAALDLAILLVHLELRALRAECTTEVAAATAAAVLAAYRPDPVVRARLTGYAALVRVRLAGQYAFRPGGVDTGARLLDHRPLLPH